MQSRLRVMFVLGMGMLQVMAISVLTPTLGFAQLSASKIISIEGATIEQAVMSKEGRIVEVSIPSQSIADIQTERFAASGQGMREVAATIAAIVPQEATPHSQVTVVTSKGQVITMEIDTMTLKGLQRGDQLILRIP